MQSKNKTSGHFLHIGSLTVGFRVAPKMKTKLIQAGRLQLGFRLQAAKPKPKPITVTVRPYHRVEQNVNMPYTVNITTVMLLSKEVRGSIVPKHIPASPLKLSIEEDERLAQQLKDIADTEAMVGTMFS